MHDILSVAAKYPFLYACSSILYKYVDIYLYIYIYLYAYVNIYIYVYLDLLLFVCI